MTAELLKRTIDHSTGLKSVLQKHRLINSACFSLVDGAFLTWPIPAAIEDVEIFVWESRGSLNFIHNGLSR